jgi:hypothetical protein
MWDTPEPRLDEVPSGGTLNVVDRVGLRNSVRKASLADFDPLALGIVNWVWTDISTSSSRDRNGFKIDIQQWRAC